MQSFIEEFFSCRECARHFGQAIEGGKALEDIENYNDAVLLLWRVHNKANLRLAGDISEDPTFPKQVFPSVLTATYQTPAPTCGMSLTVTRCCSS